MPRNRTAPSNVATDTPVADTNVTTVTKPSGGNIRMALTIEQIQELRGKTRQKGVYISKLTQFVASGEGGVCVNEEWPELAEKAMATLKQGFENAKNSKNAPEGSENVQVVGNDEKVYLLNNGVTA